MERFTTELARGLAASGRDSVCVIHPGAVACKAFAGLPIDEIRIPWPSLPRIPGHYLIENWLWSRRAARVLASRPVDAVSVQGFVGTGFPPALRRKTLLHLHGYESFQPAAPVVLSPAQARGLRAMSRLATRRSRSCVAYTAGFAKKISEWLPVREDRIVVVPNAVSDDFEQRARESSTDPGPTSSVVRFGFIGRDEPRKNLVGLLEAIRPLAESGAVTLTIVSPGDPCCERPTWLQVRSPITDLSLLWDFYTGCDAIIVPSLMEGMPTVILDAMAAAVPVIATDVGAVADMVTSATGVLVGDTSVGSLRAALVAFMALPSGERSRRGANARKRVLRDFTWDAVAGATRKALASVAGSSTATASAMATGTGAE